MKMKKKCLCILIILFVSMISISIVSAADSSAGDNNISADNQDINLEKSSDKDILSANDLEAEKLEKTSEESASNTNETKKLSKSNTLSNSAANASPTVSAKAKTGKVTDKNAFKTIGRNSKDKVTVKKIQKALKKNGYYIKYKGHYLKVDGWYGPCTERSVKQFQKAKGLKVTGKVDYKTAVKLKIINDKYNCKILLDNTKTFKGEYNSGIAFNIRVINKTTGKAIKLTKVRVDVLKNGKIVKNAKYYNYYYVGEEFGADITPDHIKVGSYKIKISSADKKVKAEPVTKNIKIAKTSIKLQAKKASISSNDTIQLKAVLKFKNNEKVNEGKVKFTIDGKSYTANVKNGVATKNIKVKDLKSKQYQVKFLGNKNIYLKSATGKIE